MGHEHNGVGCIQQEFLSRIKWNKNMNTPSSKKKKKKGLRHETSVCSFARKSKGMLGFNVKMYSLLSQRNSTSALRTATPSHVVQIAQLGFYH